jgi:hypothetical protein
VSGARDDPAMQKERAAMRPGPGSRRLPGPCGDWI